MILTLKPNSKEPLLIQELVYFLSLLNFTPNCCSRCNRRKRNVGCL